VRSAALHTEPTQRALFNRPEVSEQKQSGLRPHPSENEVDTQDVAQDG
jgi:hypothetical protein